jgi:hypothetical protein
VAVAIEAPVKTDPGKVAFYRPNGKLVRTVDVGVLPDMLTFLAERPARRSRQRR